MNGKPNARELICELHKRDGAEPVALIDGLWNRRLDTKWEIWVNGHPSPVETHDGFKVSAGDVYVEYNGFPAGTFSMITGEGVLAAGDLANYDTFCAALRQAIDHPL